MQGANIKMIAKNELAYTSAKLTKAIEQRAHSWDILDAKVKEAKNVSLLLQATIRAFCDSERGRVRTTVIMGVECPVYEDIDLARPTWLVDNEEWITVRQSILTIMLKAFCLDRDIVDMKTPMSSVERLEERENALKAYIDMLDDSDHADV